MSKFNWTDWFAIGLVVVSFIGLGVVIGIDWSS